MAIGVKYGSGGGEDILPIVKYNAKAGMFTRIDRVNQNGTWVKDEVDITNVFKAVFDLETFEVGWMNFDTGGAPDFRLVPWGGDPGDKPGDKYRMGVRCMILLAKDAGGDVREFCTVAGVALGAFDALHDAYLAGVKENPGKLPIVVCTGKKGVKSQYGTNFEPQFQITQWIARPESLVFKPKARSGGNSNGGAVQAPAQNVAGQSGPPSTGATKVSAPSASTADASKDFG